MVQHGWFVKGRPSPDKFRGRHPVRLSMYSHHLELEFATVGGRICGSSASPLRVVINRTSSKVRNLCSVQPSEPLPTASSCKASWLSSSASARSDGRARHRDWTAPLPRSHQLGPCDLCTSRLNQIRPRTADVCPSWRRGGDGCAFLYEARAQYV